VRDGRVVTPEAVKVGVAAIADAGFIAATHDHDDGGMQLPHVIATAAMLWLDAANVATSSYAMLTSGVANLIASFGTPSQRREHLDALLTGRSLGTMALTEPEAGSSLADLRTLATPIAADGRFRITGTKMWISGGEHELSDNIIHMVLARVAGAPPGVRGISLMLVPRYRASSDGQRVPNGVVLGGLIHKMGWRGTTSTILNFGEREECIGELVGPLHGGLACMFQMMNEARIGVGRAATAMTSAAFHHALSYARVRSQGRLAGEKDAQRPPVPIIQHPDVRRMLLTQKVIAEGAIALILECAYLVDEMHTSTDEQARRAAAAMLDVLTPIAKAWPADAGQEAISLALQTLGGYGFAREYPIEQYYRDNRLNAIHEGTNGVQALDLLGRKVGQHNGAGFAFLTDRMRMTAAEAATEPALQPMAAQLREAIFRLERVTALLLVSTSEPARALANATPYLELMSRTVIGWLWLRQARVASRALSATGVATDTDFLRGKVHAARFWFNWELPRTEQLSDLLASGDATPFDMQDAWY
jgi:butyryl-CoA dehydrogenase